MKVCAVCGLEQLESKFGKRKKSEDGLSSKCLSCLRSERQKWRAANPELIKLYKKSNKLRSDYGITLEEFQQIQKFQKFRCAICQRPLEKPQVDHNHFSGQTRGLLCWFCNNALGKFRDNPELLRRAADYLQNSPITVCLGPRYGLPGRISTHRKRRRKLALLRVTSGLVEADKYLIVYPNIFEDLKNK